MNYYKLDKEKLEYVNISSWHLKRKVKAIAIMFTIFIIITTGVFYDSSARKPTSLGSLEGGMNCFLFIFLFFDIFFNCFF